MGEEGGQQEQEQVVRREEEKLQLHGLDTHTHIIFNINMSVLLCTIQHNVLCFYKLSRYFSTTDICSKSFHHTILFLYSIEPINYFHSLINKTYGDPLLFTVTCTDASARGAP